LKRGDLITVALPGDYGKPRPAIVIETDLLVATESVLIVLITSDVQTEIVQRRVLVEPSPENGLRATSQIQVDKIFAVKRHKCGEVFGHIDCDTIEQLNIALALIIGLLD